jgi:VWFA-related protein
VHTRDAVAARPGHELDDDPHAAVRAHQGLARLINMHRWRWRNLNNRIGVTSLILAAGFGLRAQAPEPEVRARESAPPFQIRVQTNLVTVRVIVRDAQGHPVQNLHKEDFRLFDGGKPREISGFAVETSAGASAPTAPSTSPAAGATPAPPFPRRFVTLFFDDLHLDDGAVGETREAAWRYLSTALRPEDRAAIVTSSGRTGIDFTGDREKLHDVLFKVAGHSRTVPTGGQCPAIGEYQAYLMDQRQQSDAIDLAVAEGWECRCKGINESGECRDTERRQAVAQAGQIWSLAETQSLNTLDLADAVVRRMAGMPGQRILVLVSPGFLTTTHGKMIDALIDRAVRQNVVVNAIDAAGLYTRDSRSPILITRLDLQTAKNQIVNAGLNLQRDVLAGIAAGTGGTFFHNSNDFNTAFRETGQAPELVYILSFSLAGGELDGRFHTLRVALNNSSGFDIQARRGYFANPEKAPTKSDIESAVFSLDERQDFPATVSAIAEPSALKGTIHVDIRDLQFRKEGGRNLNTLIFDTALFDHDGKYVEGKESSLDFRLPDARLEKLRQSGINAETRIQVAPGAYRIREVVRDTESKKTAALNSSAQVSAEPRAQIAVPPQPAAAEKQNQTVPEWTIDEFLRAVPDLAGLNPAPNQDRLPGLLDRAEQNVKRFFDALPATSAHERIALGRLGKIGHEEEEFNYQDLPRPGGDGVGREEFRTDAAGQRTEPKPLEDGYVTNRFASMMALFHPLYRSESTFRYLGAQNVNGEPADVVYFAQIPGKARFQQVVETGKGSLQILVQGLAWIDSDSRIVRLRAELLEPHDDPDLKMQTTDLLFKAVHFKDVAEAFWLPQQVMVTMKWRGAEFRNRHEYSDFQLLRPQTATLEGAPHDLPRETTLLAQFKPKIRLVLSQVPNYTCLETIQRSLEKRREKAFSPLDSMHLEVSTLADKELLAWPGAHRFEEVDLSSFAAGGLLGSGVFASLARGVFLHETATITGHGGEELAGRPVTRFDYRVPAESSGYQIQTKDSSAKVGIAGSFWIDPVSLELVRLEVRADDLPAALGILRTVTTIDYAPMRVADSNILLPQAAQMILTQLNGDVNRNDIQFSHCHEYLAESSIRFDTPNSALGAQAQQRRTIDLPAGLRVRSNWKPSSTRIRRMPATSCAATSRAMYVRKAKPLSPRAPLPPAVSVRSNGSTGRKMPSI